MELWTYEQGSWAQGCEMVCGVDEAGAGPLMGPVYAAAVILPRECVIEGLNDSKKLSERTREMLYNVITCTALAWSVASVSAAEIDATDILSARMKAMQLAIDGLTIKPDMALIDGNRDHGCRQQTQNHNGQTAIKQTTMPLLGGFCVSFCHDALLPCKLLNLTPPLPAENGRGRVCSRYLCLTFCLEVPRRSSMLHPIKYCQQNQKKFMLLADFRRQS